MIRKEQNIKEGEIISNIRTWMHRKEENGERNCSIQRLQVLEGHISCLPVCLFLGAVLHTCIWRQEVSLKSSGALHLSLSLNLKLQIHSCRDLIFTSLTRTVWLTGTRLSWLLHGCWVSNSGSPCLQSRHQLSLLPILLTLNLGHTCVYIHMCATSQHTSLHQPTPSSLRITATSSKF